MISEWIQKVGSSIPRGFSRYFILDLLKKEPHTGKEIIDCATQQSNGIWRPSPGLIYPLLKRLVNEGIIKENGDGRYDLTQRGRIVADDIESAAEIVKRHLDVLFRLKSAGGFVAMDLIERMASMGSILSANAGQMTDEETARYRQFLESELERIRQNGTDEGGRKIEIE